MIKNYLNRSPDIYVYTVCHMNITPCKPPPPITAPAYPQDHVLHEFESTLPKDTSTQPTDFLAKCFLKDF